MTCGLNARSWSDWLNSSLDEVHQKKLFRCLRKTEATPSSIDVTLSRRDYEVWLMDELVRGGTCSSTAESLANSRCSNVEQTIPDDSRVHVKLFSTNDYLGLATHTRVRDAMAKSAGMYGMGPRSSAVVGGYTSSHRELESGLAELKGTEEALLFPTGYAANVAVLSVLGASSEVDIFSDELNHASIVDGARLAKRAGAGLYIYNHNDMSHLDSLLASSTKPLKIMVTDSLFSMDGDYADLKGLVRLKQRYQGCLLAIDEAHATLVCGRSGAGVAEVQGVGGEIDLHIGTLSKAFGGIGGFVTCSRSWKDLLVNRGRTQMFSTALPVPIVEAVSTAMVVAKEEPWRREYVTKLSQSLGGQSHIIPIIVGDESKALAASATLLQKGMHVPAIRPPTVPRGSSRLRISLSASHSIEDAINLLRELRELKLVNKSVLEYTNFLVAPHILQRNPARL